MSRRVRSVLRAVALILLPLTIAGCDGPFTTKPAAPPKPDAAASGIPSTDATGTAQRADPSASGSQSPDQALVNAVAIKAEDLGPIWTEGGRHDFAARELIAGGCLEMSVVAHRVGGDIKQFVFQQSPTGNQGELSAFVWLYDTVNAATDQVTAVRAPQFQSCEAGEVEGGITSLGGRAVGKSTVSVRPTRTPLPGLTIRYTTDDSFQDHPRTTITDLTEMHAGRFAFRLIFQRCCQPVADAVQLQLMNILAGHIQNM